MGLIQRIIEKEGIATISISLSRQVTQKVRPPRALYPGFPMGHPIGFPNQVSQQLNVLRQLLFYLKTIERPGTIIDIIYTDPIDPMSDRAAY